MPAEASGIPEPVLISDLEGYAKALQDFIFRNPMVLGGSDIILADSGTALDRSAALVATLLAIVNEKGDRAIQRHIVLAPPNADVGALSQQFEKAFGVAYKALTGDDLSDAWSRWLQKHLTIEAARDLRPSTLHQLIEAAPDWSALFILDAARYRDDAVQPFLPNGAARPLRDEDIWAPQVHALARAATARVKDRPVYLAIDADKPMPERPELVELLQSVNGCGVFGGRDDDSTASILSLQADVWDAWIGEGRVGKALQDVEALPKRFNRMKPFLRLQLLHKAGQREEAAKAVRELLDLDADLDPTARAKLALVAQDNGAPALARRALEPALEALETREALEIAFDVARRWDDPSAADRIAERLEANFPQSDSVRARRHRALLNKGDYATLAAEADQTERAAAYAVLDRFLTVKGVPDYVGLLGAAGSDGEIRDAVRNEAVGDALRRGLLPNAFTLAAAAAESPRFQTTRDHRLVEVMEALLLHADAAGDLCVPTDDFTAALESLIRSLAARPEDGRLRVRLGRLLQPSLAGSTGLAEITAVALKLAGQPVNVVGDRLRGRASVAWLADHKPFFRKLFSWLEDETPVVLGSITAPKALITESADEAVSSVTDFIQRGPLLDEGDETAFLTWLAIGVAISPHTADPNYDLRLIRVATSKLASAGFAQGARDLAERAIQLGTTPLRRRLGWFALADALLRGRNAVEGLVALACAFAAGDVCDEEQAFQEAFLLARTLRDLGMIELAQNAAQGARQIMERMGLVDTFGHRLDTFDLQLRVGAHLALVPDTPEFQAFLAEAMAVGQVVLEGSDGTEPIGAVLAELIRRIRLSGATPAEPLETLFTALINGAQGHMREHLRGVSEATPSAHHLLRRAQVAGAARYSDDVGFDTVEVALLASRALASDDFLANASDAVFALEMAADRGVATPGWDGVAEPPPAPSSTGEALDQALALTQAGAAIVQAGWDEAGNLVRTELVDGQDTVVVREDPALIDRTRFLIWSARYPYAYGIVEDDPNLFYTTTETVRFSSLPPGPVVVVGDTGYQAFPPNLIRVGDDFAGRTQAMASTPSLAWLAAARRKAYRGDGRRCAWISAAEEQGQTLAMIAERLGPTFDAHGFAVDRATALPTTLSGASIAVITAHGGVHPEGKFFHVVSDEGTLRVAPFDLADALHNVALVVLFVCSGGRADKHPAGNTTLGLAKQILDRGCGAVVGSPWPLDSRAPTHWFPVFIEHLEAGATLIEANFLANQAVDRAFGLDPARGLAMTVYGDPFLGRL